MTNLLLETESKNQKINVRPEVELLLGCTRTCIDDINAKRIKTLLQEDINWEYLVQTAHEHGVLPLLFWSLNTNYAEFVPTATLNQLRRYYYANAQRSLILASKLVKVLDLFEANGIPVIPFKGPVLAVSAYGELSRRDFCDLDILVHRKDFLKIKELLTAQGYQSYASSSEQEAAYLKSLTNKQQEAYLRSHWELHFVNEREQVIIDVHQGILPKQYSFLYDTEWVWEHTEILPFINRQILSFSLEDLILILCSQGAKDCWQQLNRICDIAEVIRSHPQVNWEKIWERATKLRMRRILLLGLSLAHELLDADLPKTILQKIEAAPAVKSLTSQIYLQLFNQTEGSVQSYKVKNSSFHLKLIEHPGDKIWYCFHHLIVPTVADQTFIPLPEFLSFLYYLLRPIRLIKLYVLPQHGK